MLAHISCSIPAFKNCISFNEDTTSHLAIHQELKNLKMFIVRVWGLLQTMVLSRLICKSLHEPYVFMSFVDIQEWNCYVE